MNRHLERKGRAVAAIGVLLLSAFGVVTALGFVAPAAHAAPTCTTTVQGENVANNAVQSAINAAGSGATICLAAGVYPEQLAIHTPGLTLLGAGRGATVIEPTSVAATTYDFDAYPQPLAAVVLVNNTTGVTIQSLGVDGLASQSSITGCGESFVGIDYQNASGVVSTVSVLGIEASNSIGCGTQQAIYVYSGWFHTHFVPASPLRVTVTQSTVASYGKNGITCDDLGVNCTITHDTAVGIGPTNLVAQNGIQVAFGANATVQFDTATQHSYTGLPAPQNYFTALGNQAAGILVFSGSRGVIVQSNSVGHNDLGISFVATPAHAAISGNKANNNLGDGIEVDLSFNSTLMFGLPSFATLPYVDNITGNHVHGSPVGILAYDTNSTISGNNVSASLAGIETVTDNAAVSYSYTVTHNLVLTAYLGIALGTGILAQPVGLGPDAIFGGDPQGLYDVNNNTVAETTPALPAERLAGISVYGQGARVAHNTVSGYHFTGTGAQVSFYNATTPSGEPGTNATAQGAGIFAICVVTGCAIQSNTLQVNDIGILDEPFTHDNISHNQVINSRHYGIVADGFPGGGANVTNNLVADGISGAVGVLLDNGTFNVSGNAIRGSSDTGSSGASQEVCGPGAFIVCATETNVSTAAVQIVSESASGTTTVTFGANTYAMDVRLQATLSVNGGSVTIL